MKSDNEKDEVTMKGDGENILEDNTNIGDPDNIEEIKEKNEIAEATIISEEIEEDNGEKKEEEQREEIDDDANEKDKRKKQGRISRYWKTVYNKKVIFVGYIFGAILIFGISQLFFENKKTANKNIRMHHIYISSVEDNVADVFYFKRFIILMNESNEKTYFLLSLSVTPSNGRVYREVKDKRTICRKAVYEILKKHIKNGSELKNDIIKNKIIYELNTILVTGKIENITFGEYLII